MDQKISEGRSSVGILPPTSADDASESSLGEEREGLRPSLTHHPDETLRGDVLVRTFQGKQLVDYRSGGREGQRRRG